MREACLVGSGLSVGGLGGLIVEGVELEDMISVVTSCVRTLPWIAYGCPHQMVA